MINKKVLIVTLFDIFERNSSETLTILSMMGDVPRENIYQLIFSDLDGGEVGRLSQRVFKVGHDDVFLHQMVKANHTTSEPSKAKTSEFSSFNATQTKSANRLSVKQILKLAAIDFYYLMPYRISYELRSYMDDVKPDYIYTACSSYRAYELMYALSKKYSIPFLPHFFDDWPNITFRSTALSKLLHWLAQRRIGHIVRHSRVALCISQHMCNEYQRRYRFQHFLPFMHSVEKLKSSESLVIKKKYIYAGSLYLGRYISLVEIAKCFAKFQNTNSEIVIFTEQRAWESLKDNFKDYPFVRFGGFVPVEQLMEEIATANGLLFIESFDESQLRYTEFSRSTKIPEYLSSEKPILATGNSRQGSIKYLSENQLAYVATDIKELPAKVKEYLELSDWDNMRKRAVSQFFKYHELSVQKERFRNALNMLFA